MTASAGKGKLAGESHCPMRLPVVFLRHLQPSDRMIGMGAIAGLYKIQPRSAEVSDGVPFRYAVEIGNEDGTQLFLCGTAVAETDINGDGAAAVTFADAILTTEPSASSADHLSLRKKRSR